MKRFLSALLAIVFMLNVFFALSISYAASANSSMTVGTATEKTQYSGEYIVAYNPSISYADSASTGNFNINQVDNDTINYDKPIRIPDADIKLLEKTGEPVFTKETYTVGSKKTFTMYYNVLDEGGTGNFSFECLAVGAHCYIWQPVNNSANSVFRTRIITTSEANSIKSEFESKYSVMKSAFGEYPSSYGKLNILVYDIQDNYNNSSMFVGGYFTGNDIWNWNYLPIIHIDTYPQMNMGNGIAQCYSTLFHELQHLINFIRTDNQTPKWLNEMMSAAAEEITYPGSCVPERLEQWNAVGADFVRYHAGGSLYDFDNSLGAYAMMAMLSQYLRIQTGSNAVYDKIITNIQNNQTTALAVKNALTGSKLAGMNMSELMLAFRVATVALNNTGIFGFNGESVFYGLRKVRISSAKTVQGGGAVVIHAKGTYKVPSNADKGLVYVGIDADGKVYADPAKLSGPTNTLSLGRGETLDLNSTMSFSPSGNKVQKYLKWESSKNSVARIDSDGIITGKAEGECTITATTVNGITYTRNVVVDKQGIFTVRFLNWDNGLIKEEQVKYGESATAPEVPKRLGYEFTGWDKSFSRVTSNLEVKAQYKIISYYVMFVDGVNDRLIKSENYEFGTILTEDDFPEAPVHSGYKFVGWDYRGQKVTKDLTIVAMYEKADNLLGDVTLDGEVNTADAVQILKFSASICELSSAQKVNADTNGDGDVNTADAVLILKFSAGILPEIG